MNKELGHKDTVIFDLDGTLLNTLEDLRDSVNVMMRRHGYPEHSLEQIRNFVGNGVGNLIARSIPHGRDNGSFDRILEEFRDYYTKHCRIKTKPYEGVPEMIKTLSERGYKIAIVSNKNDAAVKELNEIYFSRYTDAAVGDRAGVKRKPAPDLVFLALDEIGSERERAVYIGDSDVDYDTAQNSGLDCILVSWGFRDRELLESFPEAVVVDDCAEILRLLGIC